MGRFPRDQAVSGGPRRGNIVKRAVDLLLSVGLLLLMSFQVTGEAAHEWTGIAMTALMLAHLFLNRRWWAALFKGRYTPLRAVQTLINAALLACFVLTALSGISMSVHAVPFLGGFMRASLSRRLHLALSHWCFVLMGLHLGLHLPAMLRGLRGEAVRRAGWGLSLLAAGAGFYLFLKNSYPDYLFCRVPFAFFDYDKAAPLVLLEALLIAAFWAFVGAQLPTLLNRRTAGKRRRIALLGVLLAVALGVGLTAAVSRLSGGGTDAPAAPWAAEDTGAQVAEATETAEAAQAAEAAQVDDGFVWIEGGSFLMGSPEAENWRIDDETQHEVALTGFWMSPYEATQAEYRQRMGVDPSSFSGDGLPVENVSWMDAVRFCNEKSRAAGLTPAYAIDGETVVWDRAANGYRLPTEAEWEYACRAGTTTPFNTVHSIGPDEADYYGHYPNWWASIPMPVATFLESYDLSGKTILPFCSHGGGRFGQSLTAIAKLAPQSVIGPGLSVHYSGGATLPEDVGAWLEAQGLR